MKILFFIELLCLSLCQFSLYLQHIIINNDNEINFDLYSQKIPEKITKKDIFDIIIHSENNEEQNITFKCSLFGKNSINSTSIKCILKDKIILNDEGPFYISKEHLQKSFGFYYNEKFLYFTIEIIEEFYLGKINIYKKENNENFLKVNITYQNLEYNCIPISMALDNNYLYPTIIAIITMLKNSNQRTKYNYYIMHSPDFSEENKNLLMNLEEQYNNCRIYLINMGEKYKEAAQNKKITTPTYYRLSLPIILPYLDKIIWIDGDTMTYTDLKELFDLDMKNFYFKGILDETPEAIDHITFENDHAICAGIMLINLKELRKDNMINKFEEFIKENNHKLIQHDQTTINALCYDKIGILPPKFGIFNYNCSLTTINNNKNCRYKYKYSNSEILEAYNYPSILHLVFKPWTFQFKYLDMKYWMLKGGPDWWDYVNQTGFLKQVMKTYPKPNIFKRNKKIIKKFLIKNGLIILFLIFLILILILKCFNRL